MRRLLKIVGWTILLIELLIVGVAAFLQTDTGKAAIARAVGHFAYDAAEETGVKIKGITGEIPWDVRIDSVELYDRQGVYATLDQLHLAWEPKALFKRHLHIRALEAADIHLARAPLPPLHPKAAPSPKTFSLPHIPSIALDKLDLQSIRLDAGIAGSDQQWRVGGAGSGKEYRVKLATLRGPDTKLDLDISLLPSAVRARGVLDEAPGGVVLDLLKTPGQDRLHLALDTTTDAQGVVHLDKGDLTLGNASLAAQGDYHLDNNVLHADIALHLPDIGQFSRLAGTLLAGSAELHLAAQGPLAAIHAQLDAQCRDFVTGSAAIPTAQLHADGQWNGKQTAGTLKTELTARVNDQPVMLALAAKSAQSKITVDSLDAGYGPYLGHVTGTIDPKARTMDLALESRLPSLETLAPQLHAAGTAQAKAEAKGTFDRFNVKAALTADSSEGRAEVDAKGDVNVAQKSVTTILDGKFLRDRFTFDLHAPFTANAQEIDLKRASLKGKGFTLAADMHWLLAQAAGQGNLSLDAPDLAPLGALLGQHFSGAVEGQGVLDASQNLSLRLAAKDVTANGVRLAKAQLRADLQDLAKPGKVDLGLTAGPVTADAVTVDSVSLSAQGDWTHTVAVKARARGNVRAHPFEAALEGSSDVPAAAPARKTITLSRLDAVYEKSVIALAAPARLTLGEGRYNLTPLKLRIAGGQVTARGAMQPGRVDAGLTIDHVQLQSLPGANLPEGVVQAMLKVTGKPDAPTAALDAQLYLLPGQHPLNADLKGNWHGDRLGLQAQASLNQAKFAGNVAIRAPFSLTPFVAGIKGSSPLSGSGSLDAALESFNSYLSASGQRVAGKAAGRFTLAGALSAPLINGRLNLTQGRYDLQEAGICLRDVSALLTGSGEKVTLDSLSARSVDGGLLKADARAQLTGGKALAGHVLFSRYRLFCGGLASGDIEGNLDAGGTLSQALLNGVLTFPSLNIQLPGNAPHKTVIPTIKTERVSLKTGKAVGTARPAPGTGNDPLRLSVRVHVPGRMFVRGRGLDAEFSGDLDIKGPATNPVIAGQFETKRGNFELLDKTLKLVSAVIRFEGPVPPSPFLDIQAETTVNATTIDVALSGPAAKPDFTLTSTPALPQDEILAQLLFGRELSSLGPFQVAQLAQAAAELSGYSSGPGVLGKVRSFLGIDTLNVGTDTNNDVNVGAGKYITDKVYVGVTQGAKPDSRAVTTEVEVYPHVSGTTGISQNGQQNLGLQWKYDY